MIATKTTVEIVRFQPESERSHQFIQAMALAGGKHGFDVHVSRTYQGDSSLLMFWGPGAPDRSDAMRRQVNAGGHAIALDLPYWDRYNKVRISIDAPHPQAWVMRKALSSDRFIDDGIALTNEWNPNGPIVIAGLGPKALMQYGQTKIAEWEADMMRDCAARWSRPVIYRPKKTENAVPAWATKVSRSGPIESVLRGASLVITWHSNVAVDAIRMGIPVVCRDGAAAAVCPSVIGDRPQPLATDVRNQFLSNLAFFQWAPSEAGKCWAFLQELLS